jgi:UDP-3-O-[3-hydroxymyristoyl] glucosamine N-acyltransferase LpxD
VIPAALTGRQGSPAWRDYPNGYRKHGRRPDQVDEVEVGALTAIDRGTLKSTRIGHGIKIGDLVMIGHNIEIGMDCLLCGQVGLAGGVMIGDGAVLGGRVGVADHLTIGAWAVVGAAACVGTNVPAGAVYTGYPAVPRATRSPRPCRCCATASLMRRSSVERRRR